MHSFMFQYIQYQKNTFGSSSSIRCFSSRPYRSECLSPWVFTQLMNVIAAHLRLHAIPLFPYLDDWQIRDLIRCRLISHTKYTLQTVQNLGFIPNLKKSGLIPTQQFTFIGMEFLTQQEIVRVPADRVKALILTIKTMLSQFHVSAQTFLSLLGKLSSSSSSRFNSSRQIAFTASANVPIIDLETSHSSIVSLGGSVGCTGRLETRRSQVQPPADVGNILLWRLIMKYFQRSFSSFR